MKVISLLQPWAMLVAIGEKKFETRSWNTKYRGEILIHASQSKKGFTIINNLPESERKIFGNVLHDKNCDFGFIIGKATISATTQTHNVVDYVEHWQSPLNDLMDCGVTNWQQELVFGDYSPCRYAWLLKNPKLFDEPISCNGALSLWDLPKELEIEVLTQML